MKKQKNNLNNILFKLIVGMFFLFFSVSVNVVFAEVNSACQHISGSGPLKVVFLKEDVLDGVDNSQSDAYNFINLSKTAINAFKTINPYASYFSRFSFYIDTVSRNFVKDVYSGQINTMSDSSCGSDAFEYIHFVSIIPGLGSYTYGPGLSGDRTRVIHIDITQCNPETFCVPGYNILERAVVHETGHILGLSDEYTAPQPSLFYRLFHTSNLYRLITNCVPNPSEAYKSTIDNKKYGLTNISGCTSPFSNVITSSYYRPSQNSIMKDGFAQNKFNVISCGYLVAGLLGQSTSKASAQTHWPECCKMDDIIKDNIPGCAPDITISFPTEGNEVTTKDYTSSDNCPIDSFFVRLETDCSVSSVPDNNDYSTSTGCYSGPACSVQSNDGSNFCGEPSGPSGTGSYCGEKNPSVTTICSPSKFTNKTILPATSTDSIIAAAKDIPLKNTKFFKIDGTDVSVSDGSGGRKIPEGELATISVDTDAKFEIEDKYCREDNLNFTFVQMPINLKKPFSCFFNCDL
jgi:hypothetical protein